MHKKSLTSSVIDPAARGLNRGVLVFSALLGWTFDNTWVYRSEDATDRRSHKATVRVRWVSVFLATAVLIVLVALLPALFWDFGNDLTMVLWGGVLGGTVVGDAVLAWATNLPVGVFAPLATMGVWAIAANRLTVSGLGSTRLARGIVGATPKPFSHTWRERYAVAPHLFWFMFALSMAPTGIWLVLRHRELAERPADATAGWLAALAVVFGLLSGFAAGRRLRTKRASDAKTNAEMDEVMNHSLGLPAGFLATARKVPADEREYITRELPPSAEHPQGAIKFILPEKAWSAISEENLPSVRTLLAKHWPEKQLGEVGPKGFYLVPVTPEELKRREAVSSSGGITSAATGFIDPEDDDEEILPTASY